MASAEAESGATVHVKQAMLAKAVRALSQVVAKRTANANPLFGETAETMTLLFSLSTIPEGRKMKPCIIELPHPLYDDKAEVCFISKDPQKRYKDLLLQQHPVPGLTKVIGVDKLRRNYKTIEAKRALADAFDLFLCDSKVIEIMPKLLGSIFYQKKHKPPIPVRLRKDPKPALKQAIAGTVLRVPSGPCVPVKIGRCSMPEEHLIANATAVIAGVAKYFSNRNPLQSVSVQATDAPALPIWRRPRPPGALVDMKKYHSDAASSAASDTGASGASETERDSEAPTSEAAETLSTRDTSDVETTGGTASELDTAGETQSELDSEAGDTDEQGSLPKEDLPLFIGLKKKKRRRGVAAGTAAPAAESTSMPPPAAKKARKGAA